jgi:AraC-like DNA-binding protein
VETGPVPIKSSAAHGWDETLVFDVDGPPTGECRHDHEHVSLQIWWQPVGMRSLKAGSWRSVQPGARLWLPGEEQYFEWRRSARVNIVFIRPERVERILEQPYSRSNFDAWRTLEFRSPFVAHVVAAMAEDVANDCPAGALVGDSLTIALVAYLAGGPRHVRAADSFPGPSPKSFERALQYIEANLALPLRVADLASAAGCSARQLSRAFRQQSGKLPHDYVIERRVKRASSLIDAGQLSLAQVAAAVGFADQSQMTKMFRKLLGTTPGRLRKGRAPDENRARRTSDELV